MNKSLKDVEPKGRLNPAGPGSYELPEWTAFNWGWGATTKNLRRMTFDSVKNI